MVSLPELTLLFIIGLLILGPERLPRVASQIGRWVGKARRTANQLRYQLEREIALSDLEKQKPRDRAAPKPNVKTPPADANQSATSAAVEPATGTAAGTPAAPASPAPAASPADKTTES